MMKLYRPLCSDVTLRLAVDISPDYDEEDDDDEEPKFPFLNDNGNDGSYGADGEGSNPPGMKNAAAEKSKTYKSFSSAISPSSSPSPSSSSAPSSSSSSASSSPYHAARITTQAGGGCNGSDHINQNSGGGTNNRRGISDTSGVSGATRNLNQANKISHLHGHHHHHHNTHYHNNHGGCSFYSRQNTPDKTAKDIYNHEHVLSGDVSSEDFQKVPLDSEFKRTVEEDGYDFKEVSLFDEIENTETSTSLYDELEHNGNNNVAHHYGRSPLRGGDGRDHYRDAELSCCFKDASRLDNHAVKKKKRGSSGGKLLEGTHNHGDREGGTVTRDYANGCNKRRRRLAKEGVGKGEEGCSDENVTDDEEDDEDFDEVAAAQSNDDIMEDDLVDVEDDVEEEEDDDDDLSIMEFDPTCVVQAPEELPIDLDEDIDVVDKQVMSESMVTSFFGE
ncbi:SKI family transcriptional corepressor 2, partial [Aplysia californica]|uniref:SKI family transcriptional corepressor 2 n=1 Tax=Aplysia californica TaxID=6500 RepID=A0ABM1A4G7_APLCA